MKERIKNKLKDSKKVSQSKSKIENDKIGNEETNDVEIQEYYLGKDRDEERKRKAYVILSYYYKSCNIEFKFGSVIFGVLL